MEGALKWVLIGGGAWLLYEWSKGSSVVAAAPTGPTSGNAGTTTTNTASLTAPLSAAALAAMQSAALKAFGTSTVPATASGFQWDYTANLAFGPSHVTLAQMNMVGAQQMSLAQYMQQYMNVLAAQTAGVPAGGIAGLRAGPVQMSRDERDRIARAHSQQLHKASSHTPLRIPPTTRRRIVDKNYWGNSARSARQIVPTWVQ